MIYRQITYEERYTIGLLRRQGLPPPGAVVRLTGRTLEADDESTVASIQRH